MNRTPKDILNELSIIDLDSIEDFYPKTRDNDQVKVLRCKRSGVIFLSEAAHMSFEHYENKQNFVYGEKDNRRESIKSSITDTNRRLEAIREIITNKVCLDVGTGQGAILESVSNYAKTVHGVEPQNVAREALIDLGYTVFSKTEDTQDNYYDVVTMFHVLEHLTEPLGELNNVYKKLKSGGFLVIEVPHANDALITLFDCDQFKKFTFWSEHLILHTRNSLKSFVSHCGFDAISIRGVQRYPLSNHLYWLSRSKPGGHITWSFMNSSVSSQQYENMLSNLDMTDTLLLFARKP